MKKTFAVVVLSMLLSFALIACSNDENYLPPYQGETVEDPVIEDQSTEEGIEESIPNEEPAVEAPFTDRFMGVGLEAQSQGLTLNQTDMAEDMLGVPISEVFLEFHEDGTVIQYVGSNSTELSWSAGIDGNPVIDIGGMLHELVLDGDTLTATTSMGGSSMAWIYERVAD